MYRTGLQQGDTRHLGFQLRERWRNLYSRHSKRKRQGNVCKGTGVCSRAYSVTLSDTGYIFFTDLDARKIGKVVEGNRAEYSIGSEGETPHDGCDKTAAFCSANRPLYRRRLSIYH